MNRFLLLIIVTLVIVIFCYCQTTRNSVSGREAVEYISTFWDTKNGTDTTYMTLSEKAWYEDSIGITQVCVIWTKGGPTQQTVSIKTLKYRFVDLRKKWAYEYKTFTDTAAILRKFQTDTTSYSGGWNFSKRTPLPVDTFKLLSDTTINTVTYKRCKVSYVFNNARFEGIGWLQSDHEKKTYFQIDTAISNRIGSPLVFFRIYPINNVRSGLDREIKFIGTNFPDSVAKVFAAWKKNESTYPVR